MLKRLKNLWKLGEYHVESFGEKDEFTALLPEDKSIEKDGRLVERVMGDGKAEFFGQGTEEEYNDLVKEDKGIKGLFGTGK